MAGRPGGGPRGVRRGRLQHARTDRRPAHRGGQRHVGRLPGPGPLDDHPCRGPREDQLPAGGRSGTCGHRRPGPRLGRPAAARGGHRRRADREGRRRSVRQRPRLARHGRPAAGDCPGLGRRSRRGGLPARGRQRTGGRPGRATRRSAAVPGCGAAHRPDPLAERARAAAHAAPRGRGGRAPVARTRRDPGPDLGSVRVRPGHGSDAGGPATVRGAPMSDHQHLIGLLLGTEEDWPTAFEAIVRRLGPVVDGRGAAHHSAVERIPIEPFALCSRPRYDLVIDRLAYWYYHPREWLKKAALMDDVYLLNSPFTFQSMEKHSAYCAMLRLGMNVPETVLVPYKNPVDNARWAYTSAKYNREFDLDAVAESLGYPLFMKPFDGGGWRGVSMIRDRESLHQAYDDSGEMLMHLQQAVSGYEVFARALTIGPETMVMDFRPDQPMHRRYAVSHDFLSPQVGAEAVTIAQTVNAFFRWEFNS